MEEWQNYILLLRHVEMKEQINETDDLLEHFVDGS
jgi:hypothetical protein